MHTAVVIGESLLDVVRTRAGESSEKPGGSPLNVAVTLARLGISTELVTALGDDHPADVIEQHLARSGVRLAAGARSLAATSTASARLRPDGSAAYAFDIHWDLRRPELPAADLVHAGSMALFVGPGDEVVRETLARLGRRALVSLDPNIRPALLPPPDVVRERFERLLGHAHVVKLSDEDAAWLYPGSTDAAVLDRILGLGPALAVISRGSRGALLAASTATVEVLAPKVEVVDTIGAGDAFMGGMLARLLEEGLAAAVLAGEQLVPAELAEVGRFAATVAALTVARQGADPPYRAGVVTAAAAADPAATF